MERAGKFLIKQVLLASFALFSVACASVGKDSTPVATSAIDCNGALETARDAAAESAFAESDPDTRRQTFGVLLECGSKLAHWEDVRIGINGLLQIEPRNAELLRMKVLLAPLASSEKTETVAAIEQLTEESPALLSEVDSRTINSIARSLRDDHDLRRRFYIALFRADYRPPDTLESLDPYRIILIRDLLETGELNAAAEHVRLVSDPAVAAELLFDGRYDVLGALIPLPTPKSLAEQAEAHVDRMRAQVNENPDRLQAILLFVQSLRAGGRFDEALRESERGIALMRAAGGSEKFSDFETYAPWLLNEHAYALYDVGRNDDARAILKEATNFLEDGAPNVSQVINFATMLVQEGQFDEALTAISHLNEDFASVYGEMWSSTVRICADSFSGVLTNSDPDLKFVRTNEKENDAAFARAMLCANCPEIVIT